MTRKIKRQPARDPYAHHTVVTRGLLTSPAWAAMGTAAQALYPFLKLEWKGERYNNNGKLQLSLRQAAKLIGVTVNTAGRAFHDLQAKGFIAVTQPGCLGVEGMARAPSYELTEIPLPQSDKPEGRKLFKLWKPGADFAVVNHPIHNPEGLNGKNKTLSQKASRSRHQNRDVQADPVIKTDTPHLENSDVQVDPAPGNVIEFKTSLLTTPKRKIRAPDLSVMVDLTLCPLLAGRRESPS